MLDAGCIAAALARRSAIHLGRSSRAQTVRFCVLGEMIPLEVSGHFRPVAGVENAEIGKRIDIQAQKLYNSIHESLCCRGKRGL